MNSPEIVKIKIFSFIIQNIIRAFLNARREGYPMMVQRDVIGNDYGIVINQ